MKLKSIEIEGFRTFKSKHTFDLSNFNDDAFVYVAGDNILEPELGANDVGKSSLFEAIIWCIYGTTSVKLKAGNVANWSVGKCSVILCFRNRNENSDYLLKRTWNPNGLYIASEPVISKSVVKRIKATKAWEDKTQEEVDDFIGLDYNAFVYSVFISQFSTKFFDLDSADKLKVFSDILNFDDWIDRSEKAKRKVKDIESEIIESEKKEAHFNGTIDVLENQDYSVKSLEWKSDTKDEVERKKISIDNLTEELDKLKEDSVKLEEDKKSSANELVVIEKEFKGIEKQVSELRKKERKESNEQARMDTHREILKKKIKNIKKLSGECPECMQEVSGKYKIGRASCRERV